MSEHFTSLLSESFWVYYFLTQWDFYNNDPLRAHTETMRLAAGLDDGIVEYLLGNLGLHICLPMYFPNEGASSSRF